MKTMKNLAKATVLLALTLVLSVTMAQPTPFMSIFGEDVVCVGQEYTFFAGEAVGVEVIEWVMPHGVVILDGHNTENITVYVDSMFVGGEVAVRGWNRDTHYGEFSKQYIDLRGLPISPPPIIGSENVVVGQQYIYELHDLVGMGPYIWTVPLWMTILEGQETNTLVVEITDQGTLGFISAVRTNECGSSEPVSLKVSTATGVSDFESIGLNLYPNPVDDFICIDGIASETSIQILDQTGRVVFSSQYDQKINVSGLKPGVYVVVVATDKYMASHKIVKL